MNNDNRNLGAAIGIVVGARTAKGVAEEVNPRGGIVCLSENLSGRNNVVHDSRFDNLDSEN